MLSTNFKGFRFAGLFLSIAALFGFLVFPTLKGSAALTDAVELDKQMEAVKGRMEAGDDSRAIVNKYYQLANAVSNCTAFGLAAQSTIKAPFAAPTASLCINGALSVADPDFNRPLASSTGTGIGNGTAGNCSLSGTATATNYDVYAFNLTGCTVFPTAVDISLCGPAGCAPPGALDTMLILYRNVPAGDPLTANGGLPAVFNPASPCTNARAGNDDSGVTPTSPGGSTCSQTGSCLPQCGTSTSLSELRRNLGSGRFTVVVAGFGNTTVGNYNLYVNAPGAGCQLALSPTAASASVSGRVLNASGSGIPRTEVTISGGGLAEPMTVRTNGFGYYSFGEVPVGETYVLTANSKQYTFSPATRTVSLESSVSNADFVSEQ